MNLPLVTICVPVYKTAPYIVRCARSLFEQTYPELEFVFVDDCSPDDSMLLLQRTAEEYPQWTGRIRYVRHERNSGIATARNHAVDVARGKFLIHVDSDDWVEPGLVERLVQRQAETGADIVSCHGVMHCPGEDIPMEAPDYAGKDEMLLATISFELTHILWCRLIRTSLYTANGVRAIDGINIGEDHHVLPRLVWYASSVARVDAYLWHYNCLNKDSVTHQGQRRHIHMEKYAGDRWAIFFLAGFFADKSPACVRAARRAWMAYQHVTFYLALCYGDRAAYRAVCEDLHWPSGGWHRDKVWYFLCRCFRKLTGKYTGILDVEVFDRLTVARRREEGEPLVSVIVPNYNHERFLDKRMQSILRQTYRNFEIIILDDKSSDHSLEVIEKYRKDPHVRAIVPNAENSGNPFVQWEKGIAMAGGPLVWIAESDDWCAPDMLETLVKAYMEKPGTVLSYCSLNVVDEYGKKLEEHHYTQRTFSFSGKAYIRHQLSLACMVRNVSCAVFSRDAALSVPEAYKTYPSAGDYRFYVDMALRGGVVWTDRPLSSFVRPSTAVTLKHDADGLNFEAERQILSHIRRHVYLSPLRMPFILGYHWERLQQTPFESEEVRQRMYALWKYDPSVYYSWPFKLITKPFKVAFNRHVYW